MTVIEIRPHRWGWKVFEAPGVELKASMKLVQHRWTAPNRLKHSTTSIHIYEIRPRIDKHGVDLTSDVLLLGPLWYAGPNANQQRNRLRKVRSRSYDAVIRVCRLCGS
jgi:hypothetical protein